jgi:outer membrane protein insertion porin family
MGMNRSVYFKIQANRRLNSDNLNGKKFEDRQKKIEYLSNLSFTEPYLFHFPIIFQQSATLSKKSYYQNDAKELRSRSSFSKTLVKWLSAGIRYDFELTDIYNSKEKKNDRYERIGSLTPLIAFDFRDSAINPQEGLLVDCAYEYADPNFYSRKDIKYEKFTNTNNFYLKMWDLGVLAFSASWGVERNKATGYSMPNTKVFRLNGIDMMRGFRDDEINRIDSLPDRPDIAALNIEDRAYFDNIKIEPRFFIGDSFMFGPFFDAGSLFVNHFKPLSLRTSVGLSFKIITPVGPIDFGYGLKLKRKLIKDGTGEHWETPGAFTLSIGSF